MQTRYIFLQLVIYQKLKFAKKSEGQYMKKDIEVPKVEGISVAIVKEWNEEHSHEIFNVYLLNLKDEAIQNVLVSSKGYGIDGLTGEKIGTSTLRHSLGEVKAKSAMKIEPIVEEVFGINNEYWVSFFAADQLFDKKFIFLAETVIEANMVTIPLLALKGVII